MIFRLIIVVYILELLILLPTILIQIMMKGEPTDLDVLQKLVTYPMMILIVMIIIPNIKTFIIQAYKYTRMFILNK